jgi:aminoglycoside 3-N-acetyltransferase
VREGSTLLLHADAIVAAQFGAMSADERIDRLIEALEMAVGPSGTLVIPTFSYSFTKGEVFDVLKTPSAVGMVSERFRARPGVRRSADPIFSFASKGPRANELCSIPIKECFGPDSCFAALHRGNAQIVELGCSLTRGGTFVHYVETMFGVDYRYKKEFRGTVVMQDGERRECSVIYNVRDLSRKSGADLRRLQKRLLDGNKMRSVEVGRSRIMAVSANDLFDSAWKMLQEDPVSLIEEGAGR